MIEIFVVCLVVLQEILQVLESWIHYLGNPFPFATNALHIVIAQCALYRCVTEENSTSLLVPVHSTSLLGPRIVCLSPSCSTSLLVPLNPITSLLVPLYFFWAHLNSRIQLLTTVLVQPLEFCLLFNQVQAY